MASRTMTRLSLKNPKPSRYVVPTLAHQRDTAVFASATTVRTLLKPAGNLVRQVYLLLVLLASWSFLCESIIVQSRAREIYAGSS